MTKEKLAELRAETVKLWETKTYIVPGIAISQSEMLEYDIANTRYKIARRGYRNALKKFVEETDSIQQETLNA